MASMMASHDSQINATSDMTTIRLEIKLVRVIALTTLYTFDFAGAGQHTFAHFRLSGGRAAVTNAVQCSRHFASFPVLCVSVGP